MKVLETKRLTLHEFKIADAAFLLNIMNQPAYHQYIGDRGLRSITDAEKYIREIFESEYKKRGFGFWVIKRKETKESVGFAGLVVRDELDQPDVGYAIQQEHVGNGYAEEATRGVLEYIRNFLNFPLICAITSPGNKASINVLTKCGFHFEKCTPVFEDNEELNIYKLAL